MLNADPEVRPVIFAFPMKVLDSAMLFVKDALRVKNKTKEGKEKKKQKQKLNYLILGICTKVR